MTSTHSMFNLSHNFLLTIGYNYTVNDTTVTIRRAVTVCNHVL